MAEANEQQQPTSGEEEVTAPAAPAEVKPEPKPVTITDLELDHLRREASDYKDKYLRLLAESENQRKRLHKEKQEITRYAIQSLAVDLLTPLDHLEGALKFADQGSPEVKQWAMGFQMILSQLQESMHKHGITPFDSKGKQFDPHNHEAVEMIETTDVPAGTIIEELMRGYRMGDRTIRAARVKVAGHPAALSSTNADDQQKTNEE